MRDARCPAALSAYLGAVADALARRCIGVAAVVVPAAGRQRALTGRIDLDPATVRPGLGWSRVVAIWHEERGWWVELTAQAGPVRRYPPASAAADVAPSPTLVADFLAGSARGEETGSHVPAVHRHRLVADPGDLLGLLTRHTDATAPWDRVPSARRLGPSPNGHRP